MARSSLFHSGAMLAVNQAVMNAARFARNILVARVLAPDDMGIGATFAVTLTLLELINDVGLQKIIVQTQDGDDEPVQEMVQLLVVLRGMWIGMLIFLAAPLVVQIFAIPHTLWAFRLLALMPIIEGFTHIDLYRVQRHFDYRPLIASEAGANVLVTLVAWPIAVFFGDYRALLYLSLGLAAVRVVFSHVMRQRPFRMGWHPQYLKRFLHFGWPLLINGGMMFATIHGDRTIVGMKWGMETLGVFTIAATLATIPMTMLWGVLSRILLPKLAAVQSDMLVFARRYRMAAELTGVLGGLLALLFLLWGQQAILLLYGAKYEAAGRLVGWLGVTQSVRLMRGLPGLAGAAKGDTMNIMLASLVRTLALIPACVVGYLGMDVIWLIAVGCAGELAGLYAGAALVRKRQEVPWRDSVVPFLAFLAGLLLALVAVEVAGPSLSPLGMGAVGLLVVGLYVVGSLLVLRQLREFCGSLLFRRSPVLAAAPKP